MNMRKGLPTPVALVVLTVKVCHYTKRSEPTLMVVRQS